MKPKKERITVTVLVDDSHKDQLAAVANDLKDNGFELMESLDAIGVLTGSVPANLFAKLANVPGVCSVEEERTDYRAQC